MMKMQHCFNCGAECGVFDHAPFAAIGGVVSCTQLACESAARRRHAELAERERAEIARHEP